MAFPYDFGFILRRANDGDPIDVLLVNDEPSFPGCIVPAKLIGVLEAEQTEGGEKPLARQGPERRKNSSTKRRTTRLRNGPA
jgi:inorganic pyrophosphatase